MNHFYSFEISGTCDDKELLISSLSFFFQVSGCDNIKCFKETTPEDASLNGGVLVFSSYDRAEENWKEYSFEPNAIVLAEQILQYIKGLNTDVLESVGATPSGCEEDYELGWMLFKPDCHSKEKGIEDYDILCDLAVKPILCEYGK